MKMVSQKLSNGKTVNVKCAFDADMMREVTMDDEYYTAKYDLGGVHARSRSGMLAGIGTLIVEVTSRDVYVYMLVDTGTYTPYSNTEYICDSDFEFLVSLTRSEKYRLVLALLKNR